MSCKRCGRCCHDFSIAVEKDSDISRFFSYHGFTVVERDGAVYLSGSNPCKHLRMGKGGAYECAIYISRPQICKDYSCEK
jgi:Fe-S-cluster containining protein